MLAKALVYACCVGVSSSQFFWSRLVEDVAFRVLRDGNVPAFRVIADFRTTQLSTLNSLFEKVLPPGRQLSAEAERGDPPGLLHVVRRS